MKENRRNTASDETNEGGKFLKPAKPEKVDNTHINRIAGTLFAIVEVIAIIGAIIMDARGVSESTIGILVSYFDAYWHVHPLLIESLQSMGKSRDLTVWEIPWFARPGCLLDTSGRGYHCQLD